MSTSSLAAGRDHHDDVDALVADQLDERVLVAEVARVRLGIGVPNIWRKMVVADIAVPLRSGPTLIFASLISCTKFIGESDAR
jgi:hypothetical protein